MHVLSWNVLVDVFLLEDQGERGICRIRLLGALKRFRICRECVVVVAFIVVVAPNAILQDLVPDVAASCFGESGVCADQLGIDGVGKLRRC
jgi:hypothetical protein